MSEKILFENKWMQVLEKDGYTMYRLPWCRDGLGVAILPFMKDNTTGKYEYLGRFERCLAHGPNIKLTAITGGLDKEGESTLECAIRELEEEAGIRLIDMAGVMYLGESYDSKNSDHKTVIFAVDMDNANYIKVPIVGDGSAVEEGGYARWVSEEECMLASELRLAGMIGRLKAIYKG